MTDVKPYSRDDSPPLTDRTVAVLLVLSGVELERDVPHPLASFGGTCLLDVALQLMERVSEATERAFWADDAALIEHFEEHQSDGIQLLAAPPERSLRRGVPDALRSSHTLVLDARYPLLRPNTVDEAIRLLRVRPDIEGIVSCLRARGDAFDLSGDRLMKARSDGPFLISCDAFSLVPAEAVAYGRAVERPYAFEIGQSEGFRVSTPFARDVVGPYLASRAGAVAP